MSAWVEAARALLRAEGRAMLVTVCAAHGSAPRGPGAKMVVTAQEQEGTIGGGRLEYVATARARALLESGAQEAILADYVLGPKLDQCCGGMVRLLFEPLTRNRAAWLEAAAKGSGFLLTPLGGGDKIVLGVAEAEEIGAGRVALLDAEKRLLRGRVRAEEVAYVLEAPSPDRPHLLMFGAGHVGRALARIVDLLPLRTRWIDSRAEAFPESVPGSIEAVRTDAPLQEVGSAPPGALYLVFTHSHPLDYEITAAILARGDARYCGLIGSETKRARFIKRFRDEAGLSEAQIARLTCPIGLGGPPGKAPETIAIAVAGELLSVISEGEA